jgi:hypothetical protein
MVIVIEANSEKGGNGGLDLHIWRGLQIWRETLRIGELFKFFAWSGSRPNGDKIRPRRSDQGEERP